MPLETVAIVGANGKVGPFILQALLDAKKFDLTVISRRSSQSKYPESVHVAITDDNLPQDQLVTVLKGIDALVIAFAGSHTANSIKLVDAAFEAGVKHIIPADFGSCDSSDPRSLELVPLYGNKKDVRDYLDKLVHKTRLDGSSISWTSLITGHFFDYGLRSGLLSMDVEKRTARIFDGGSTKFSASTLWDIGLATASVLQHAQDEKLKNKLVYVQSISTTQNELVASVERATNAKFKIEEWSSDAYIKKNKALLTGNGDDHDFVEELVSVEGIVNADWESKGDAFVNDALGMPKRSLDELVKKALSG